MLTIRARRCGLSGVGSPLCAVVPRIFASLLAFTQLAFVDDEGRIAAFGAQANGDAHAVLLIPCNENHPDIEGCDYSPAEVSTVAASQATETQKQLTPEEISRIRDLLVSRHRGFMPRTIH